MGALSPILRGVEGGRVSFWCPGCNEAHVIAVEQPQANGARWGWNGSVDAPTFTPSILIRSGHFVPVENPSEHCWCTYNQKQIAAGKDPAPFTCGVCHSFVTEGRIQFLGDCTHALAGQTVPIPAWPKGDEA